MLEWLKTNTEAARARLAEEVGRFKNKDFMNGAVDAVAMMALADGTISSEEKQKMIRFFEMSPELKVFKTSEVIAEFNDMVSKYEFDKDLGEAEALKSIGKLRTNVDAARVLVRLALAVANSDGNFDESERLAAVKICKELQLNPADFDLA